PAPHPGRGAGAVPALAQGHDPAGRTRHARSGPRPGPDAGAETVHRRPGWRHRAWRGLPAVLAVAALGRGGAAGAPVRPGAGFARWRLAQEAGAEAGRTEGSSAVQSILFMPVPTGAGFLGPCRNP